MKVRRARIEELEPRVLLSGDLAGALALPPAHHAEDAPRSIVEPTGATADQRTTREVVFIDAGVENWETLVDDLLGRSDARRSIEVVRLDSDRDGLSQITDTLTRYDGDLDAVHIVSHGSGQGIQLGATWLDQGELERRPDALTAWREALSEHADVLLYGCDLAATAEGKALVGSLAGLTGADVAASNDRTGAAALGGDWVLEHTTGSIESFVVFTARTQQEFGTALGGTAVWTDKFAPGPQSSDFDGTSFGPESATLPVGYWHVMVGAEAPTRDEKIVLGTDNSGDLNAMMWNGSTWSALPGVSDSLNNREWSFDVAYSSQSGNALIVWADGSGGGIQMATWDGSILSASTPVPVPLAGNLDHIKLAADPNSDEIMLVGSVAGNGDFAMVWDGASFVDTRVLPFGDLSSFTTDINVVYEGQSGNAMIVRGGGLAGAFYDTYDGSSWGFGGIFAPNAFVGATKWTSIAADPNSDRLVMAAGTESGKVWLSSWDGTTWAVGVQAPSDNPHNDRQGVAVAFESTSGEAIAAYGTSFDDVRYQTWTPGSGWSGEQIGPAVSDHIDSLTLDSDPYSDTVMLSMVQADRNAVFIAWDGSSWGAPNTLEVDADTNQGQPFVFMWEQNPTLNTAPDLNPSAPTLPSITEDALTNPGELIANLLGASVSDPDAGAQGGIAITGFASNGSWEYSLDGGSSWIAVPGTVAESQALLLRDSDRVRFVPDGQNGEVADFDFRAWDRTTGSAGALANTTTNGGTTAFSSSVDTASITVTDLNDAPVLTPTTPSLTAIDENATTNPGDLISALLAGAIADVDLGALEGIAITGLSAGSGSWEFSTDGGSIWTAIGPVTTSAALLLRSTDRIRFVPDGQNGGTVSFDFVAWDRTVGTTGTIANASVGGGTSAFSSASDTASILVADVNDAPVLVPGSPSLTPITEDDLGNGGDPVSSLLAGVTDVDSGALRGIAITGLTSGNGTWQYSLDGGTSWNAIGAVSATSALLLRDSDLVRFVPDGQGADNASFDFQAWDQTTGAAGALANASLNGGTTAFSTNGDTASILVSSANDAPVLAPTGPSLTPITEDDLGNGGDPVSSLLAGVTDVDGGALRGIAITGLSSGNGTWQYSLDGGTSWNAVGAVSTTSALLLRDSDLVRFVPDGLNADNASFDFQAWDQTTGAAGALANASLNGGATAFSSGTDVASIAVSGLNDAPVLDDTGTMTLTDVAESDPSPPGDTVANILLSALGDRITDVDVGDPEGIAVFAVDDTNGSWQYSTDGGSIWTAFGAVTSSTAVLLDTSALIRFVPTTGYLGSAGNIAFHAWDQSVGANGQTGVDTTTNGFTSPFSLLSETATLDVTPSNFAPVLTPGAPVLSPITEDDANNPGDLVSTLIGGSISDLNAGAQEGIAITGLTTTSGVWQYSTDAGTSWNAIGAVSSTSALLLRDSDLVRFVPAGQNAESALFTFRAWDRTTGSEGTKTDASAGGGSSAFSLASDTASINVAALNDAPSLGSALLASIASDETNSPGASIGGLLGAVFSDVDAGAGFAGVAIIGNTANPAIEGVWQYSSDAGANWFAIGAVGDDASALVLGAGARVRFVPVFSYAGPTGLSLRGLDDGYAGAYSSTAFGAETRANLDASANGGTTSIAATPSSVSTFVVPGTSTDDLQDPEESEDPPPPPEQPPAETSSDADEAGPESAPVAESPGAATVTPDVAPPLAGGTFVAPTLTALPRADQTTIEAVTARQERDDHTSRQVGVGTSLSALRESYLVRSPTGTSVLTDLIFGGQRGDFLGQLDVVQDDMLDFGAADAAVVGSSLAVTGSLSVGYVLWLTRGGLLVASLLSSLPAWRLIDPIPILARLGLDEETDEGESLDTMVNADTDEAEEQAEPSPS